MGNLHGIYPQGFPVWFHNAIECHRIIEHSLQSLLTASLTCGNPVAMNYGSERLLFAKRMVNHFYEVRYSNTGSRLACFTQKDIWWEVFCKAPLRTLPAARFRRSRAIRLLRCKCLVRSFARALPNLSWPNSRGQGPNQNNQGYLYYLSIDWDQDYVVIHYGL